MLNEYKRPSLKDKLGAKVEKKKEVKVEVKKKK